MDVNDAVALVWPGEQPATEVLGGGITNHNFKVTFAGGDVYVLRVAGEQTELLGIDRAVEYEASLAAAAVGVGPEVIAFLAQERVLVTRFIPGVIVPVERMREPEVVAGVVSSLRAVHAGPPLPGNFDGFRIVEEYRTTAFAHGADVPPGYATARQIARLIELARGAVPERPCHNDLLNANFIDDGTRIRIVDWEYAGMGDVFFDLANFSVNHGFDEETRDLLLEAYLGTVRPQDTRALELMVFMSDFREAMWAVVQGAVSAIDFDFGAYAAEHFDRLERTAASESFRRALG